MDDFISKVVESFRAAGFACKYDYGNIILNKCTYNVWQRRGACVIDGQRYTKTQVADCMRDMLLAMPKKLKQLEHVATMAEKRRHIAPAKQLLRPLGINVDVYDECLDFRITKLDELEVVKLILSYVQLKTAKVPYDQGALVQCILSNPGCDTPLSMYADYLEENGQAAEAMKLRNEVDSARAT